MLQDNLWMADNGCFAQPDRYSDVGYLSWLVRMKQHQRTCLFATAPDVVQDAVGTLERSRPMMPVIRALGYPVAFVAQNGIQNITVPWDEFDCLFVGGDDYFKMSETTYALVREARSRGKWCHAGRVNSESRFMAAAMGGYDSADGTHIAFEPDVAIERVKRWVRRSQQPRLWEVA